jgi:molybdenum cofactor cytidylyltransferase
MPGVAKMDDSSHYAAIVLAAGASNRLGKPKQLLMYKDKTFLRHILDIVTISNTYPVITVLGAGSHLTAKEIPADKNIHTIINGNWKEGIASSIRCGLNALLQIAPGCHGAIFFVCDQPFISLTLVNQLLNIQQKTGKAIVACSYGDTVGTPVLFKSTFFPELLTLQGDAGAKKIIKQHSGAVATVTFPKGHIDIDTDTDYEALKKMLEL